MYNFKKHETWNNTCTSTTLNTRKKIVKNRNNYSACMYSTKCYEKKNTTTCLFAPRTLIFSSRNTGSKKSLHSFIDIDFFS